MINFYYYEVGFLRKGSNDTLSSSKKYIYRTNANYLIGTIWNSFGRVDNGFTYSSRAKVLNKLSEKEAKQKANGIEICDVFIFDFSNPTDYYTMTAEDLPAASHRISNNLYTETTNAHYITKEKNMNTNSFIKNMNFEFGKVTGNEIAYSVKGMAVGSNIGTAQESYKTYDGEITDVTGLVIKDMPLYKMPVAIKDIAEEDMVIHQGRAVIVETVNDDGTLVVVDVANATEATIFPVKNIFGFNFYTKIVNPFSGMLGEVNDSNPFGNMLPYMMLMDSSSGDTNDMLMMAMMMNQNGSMGAGMNMMLPFMLLNKNNDGEAEDNKNDVFAMMMAMNMMNMNMNKVNDSDKE